MGYPGILVDDAGFGQKAKRECAVMKGTAPLVEGLGRFPGSTAAWGINQISRIPKNRLRRTTFGFGSGILCFLSKSQSIAPFKITVSLAKPPVFPPLKALQKVLHLMPESRHQVVQRFDVSHAEGRHVDSPNDGAVMRYSIGLKLSDAVLVKRTPIVGRITGNHHLIVPQKPLLTVLYSNLFSSEFPSFPSDAVRLQLNDRHAASLLQREAPHGPASSPWSD